MPIQNGIISASSEEQTGDYQNRMDLSLTFAIPAIMNRHMECISTKEQWNGFTGTDKKCGKTGRLTTA